MKVNIYTSLNGVGLERDYLLMLDILERAGHTVNVSDWQTREGSQPADVAFHLEVPRYNLFGSCKKNILIPNAEWFSRKWIQKLRNFDEVWCKTQDCLNIFSEHHSNCKLTGFTSEDIYNPQIEKKRLFIHIAGKSLTKGTEALCEAYRNNKDMPTCFLISANQWDCRNNLILCPRIEWEDLKILINSAWFSICCSEYEGWGHYIHEALGCGSVVLTTDGAPMNEFISDERCLVRSDSTIPMALADKKMISAKKLEKSILSLSKLSDSELIEIGKTNRKGFLDRQKSFETYLLTYINNIQL